MLEKKLNQPANIEFVETPLRDVVIFLQEQHEIPFILKAKKLEEASISPDTPITMNLKGVRLSTALSLMLDELGLTYVEKEEVVLITTPADAKATLEIRVYQCRDLLAMAVPAAGGGAVGAAGGGFGGGERGIADGGFGGVASPAVKVDMAAADDAASNSCGAVDEPDHDQRRSAELVVKPAALAPSANTTV